MDRVAIFGDSFADPEWSTPDDGWEEPEGFTWVKQISYKYHTLNLAKAGTGPEYSLKQLRRWLEYQIKEHKHCYETSLIFICSDVCRLDLSCYDSPRQAVEIYNYAAGDRRHVSQHFAKKSIEWYMDIDWQIQQSCMYYSIINSYAQYFKRVLFWPIGNTKFFDLIPISHRDNFQFVHEGLNDITIRDCGTTTDFFDPRPNHLQEVNHKIMYNQLLDWIELDKPIDTSKFIYAGSLETK